MTMPRQKPGRSKQDYCTPPELLAAVKARLCIGSFDMDVAASVENAVCANYYDELMDALGPCQWKVTDGGWVWCNPPFKDIKPWVDKAAWEAYNGANVAMLVPASVGANWWVQYVEPCAYQVFLNGRITFVGQPTPYPKDCALLLYTPWGFTGHEIWPWRARLDVSELSPQGDREDQGMSILSDMRI